ISFSSYRTKMISPRGRAEELERLPGVGKYTARAVAAFALGEPSVFVETNIRTAVIHHFFSKPLRTSNAKRSRKSPKTSNENCHCICIYSDNSDAKITDAQIEEVLARAMPKDRERVRDWYFALMDYGAHLKRSGVRLNAASKHYAKQARFAGSAREARGAILRELAKGSRSAGELGGLFGAARRAQVRGALAALHAEGLVKRRGARYGLAR
ncbi:hypothetical protein KGQ55_03740, partial [Patescibacteria group bacterium]|nr:hypothetical protein [Patescibacteria group bacterium]